MATPIKNNLPPASQQWVRDIERRMADLERQNELLQVTANKNATQIGSVQTALYTASPIVRAAESDPLKLLPGGSQTVDLPISLVVPRASSRALITARLRCLAKTPDATMSARTTFWVSSSASDFEPRVVTQRVSSTNLWGPEYNVVLDLSFDIVSLLTSGSTITLNSSTTVTSIASSQPEIIISDSLTIYPETSALENN